MPYSLTDTSIAPRVRNAAQGKQHAGWFVAIGVGILTTVVRIWLARDRVVMNIVWDEASQLAIARTLGGEDWSTRGSTYRPLTGTLLAPIHWFSSDPVLTYRASLFVTAIFAGLAALLLVRLLRRLTTASNVWLGVAALVAALAPGSLLQGLWVSSEALLVLVVVATLLALLRLIERPTLGRGLAAAVLPGIGVATHGRLAPLLISVGVVVLAMIVQRRICLSYGILLGGVAVAAFAAAQSYAGWVVELVWAAANAGGRYDTLLTNLERPVLIGLSALGMTWYQLVTTVGVVAVGAWVVGLACAGRADSTGVGLTRRDALVVAVVVAPLLVISAVFMAQGDQWAGQIVYGRYWDAALGPVLALGVVLLGTGAARAVQHAAAFAFLSLLGAGALLAWRRQDVIDAAVDAYGGYLGTPFRIPALFAVIGDAPTVDVLRTTAVAALVSVAVISAALFRLRRPSVGAPLLGVLVLLLAVFASARAFSTLDMDGLNSLQERSVVSDARGSVLPPGEMVAIRWDTPDLGRGPTMRYWTAYQFYLPENPIGSLGDDNIPDAIDPAFVFASPADPTLADAGAEIVWSHAGEEFVLWEMPKQ